MYHNYLWQESIIHSKNAVGTQKIGKVQHEEGIKKIVSWKNMAFLHLERLGICGQKGFEKSCVERKHPSWREAQPRNGRQKILEYICEMENNSLRATRSYVIKDSVANAKTSNQ